MDSLWIADALLDTFGSKADAMAGSKFLIATWRTHPRITRPVAQAGLPSCPAIAALTA